MVTHYKEKSFTWLEQSRTPQAECLKTFSRHSPHFISLLPLSLKLVLFVSTIRPGTRGARANSKSYRGERLLSAVARCITTTRSRGPLGARPKNHAAKGPDSRMRASPDSLPPPAAGGLRGQSLAASGARRGGARRTQNRRNPRGGHVTAVPVELNSLVKWARGFRPSASDTHRVSPPPRTRWRPYPSRLRRLGHSCRSTASPSAISGGGSCIPSTRRVPRWLRMTVVNTQAVLHLLSASCAKTRCSQ